MERKVWMITLGTAILSVPLIAMADCGGAHQSAGYTRLLQPLLLATLALGYWVLRVSRDDSGWFRWVGQVSGWFILAASLLGFACSVYHSIGGKHKGCPLSSKASHECPHHQSDTKSTSSHKHKGDD